MKNVLKLIILTIFIGVYTLNAQDIYKTNDISFNANGSFYTSTHQKSMSRETRFSLNGYLLFHLTPKLALGPSLHFNYLITPEYSVNQKRWERKAFGIGPFFRYYFLNSGTALPFISAGYHSSIVKYPVYKDQTISHEINIGIGSEILLTESILVDLAVHYVKAYDKVKTVNQFYLPPGKSNYSKIRFSFGFGIVI